LPVRIYSLAKELKLDSKILVDICTSAGVTGKGSALASLTDEEADRVKAFISSGAQNTKAATPPKPRAVPIAPSHTHTHASAPTPAASVPPPPAPVEAASDVVRREDYIAPGGTVADRVPVLGEVKRKRPDGPLTPRPATPRTSTIKLAPLPEVAQPEPTAPPEVAAQKPDLRLPIDAIKAANRGGTKPLIDHVRKSQGKRHPAEETPATGARPPRSGGPGTPAGAGGRERPARGRDMAADATAPPVQRGRRGAKGPGVPEESAAPVGREQRQLNRRRSNTGRRDDDDTPTVRRRSSQRMIKRTGTNTAAPRKGKATLEFPCTVRSFSEAIGVPAQQVLRQLLGLGTMGNINSEIEPEMAELLAVELGVEIDFKHAVDEGEEALAKIRDDEDDPALLEPRPPVITFLGHVDHGKTSLLDRIIGIDVVSGESGGITQHIRAYEVDKDGRKISFVDTPGHEAFTEMRARGANVTDIAVLVVAADDGIMPQTEEAISHIKAAGVPIVVALNKIDLPGADVQRIYQQLAASELLPTEWGGDTEVVKTSATVGTGIDDLLETLLTIAELRDYRANPHRPATGTCLEAELHEGRGVVAKLIVQAGTLKVGDALVCGSSYGRVKAMYNTLKSSEHVSEAPPSMPVNVTGLNMAPGAGEHFFVLPDIATAREIAEKREGKSRRAILGGVSPVHVTLENLFERLGQKEAQTLNIILRADVRGSIEAIQKELTKLVHPEVKIKMLQATVGGISEADVHLADASDAVIIGFNVVPDEKARSLAEDRGVQIRRYEIIYKLTEDLKAALEGMLEPEQREVETGRALVQRTFSISRVGTIAGCRVLSGLVQRNARARLIRENRIIGDYALDSLKREKDDAREVREGLECGIKLAGFNDLKEGDILEFYKVEEIARTF
jgi:translation initiation factor IF-2